MPVVHIHALQSLRGAELIDRALRGSPELDDRVLAAACGAASRELGVPLEDVWGTLRHVEPGRVFAGGGSIQD